MPRSRQTSHRSETPPELKDERWTPWDFFRAVERRIGARFQLDVAANGRNAKCDYFFTKKLSAFDNPWGNFRLVWCNPPYSDVLPWVRKCRHEAHTNGRTVVMCLQARMDTGTWVHKPHGVFNGASEIIFCTPRIHFPYPGGPKAGEKGARPDFGTMLVVFSPTLVHGPPRVDAWRWRS